MLERRVCIHIRSSQQRRCIMRISCCVRNLLRLMQQVKHQVGKRDQEEGRKGRGRNGTEREGGRRGCVENWRDRGIG